MRYLLVCLLLPAFSFAGTHEDAPNVVKQRQSGPVTATLRLTYEKGDEDYATHEEAKERLAGYITNQESLRKQLEVIQAEVRGINKAIETQGTKEKKRRESWRTIFPLVPKHEELDKDLKSGAIRSIRFTYNVDARYLYYRYGMGVNVMVKKEIDGQWYGATGKATNYNSNGTLLSLVNNAYDSATKQIAAEHSKWVAENEEKARQQKIKKEACRIDSLLKGIACPD